MEMPAKLGAFLNTASLLSPPPSLSSTSPTLTTASLQFTNPSLQASVFTQEEQASTATTSESALEQPASTTPAAVPIDVWNLRQKARECLFSILENYSASKYLSLDPALTKPLGLLVQVTELKQYGVDGWAECGPHTLTMDSSKVVIFLCRTKVGLLKHVVEQIQKLESKSERQGKKSVAQSSTTEFLSASSRKYCIAFVPEVSEACMQMLRQYDVISRFNIDIRSFPLYFVPFDTDLISMELCNTFVNFHGNGNPTDLMYVGQALVELQKRNNKPIPQIRAIGSAAHWVSELLVRYRKEHFNTISAEDLDNIKISQTANTTDSENLNADPFIPLVRLALSENGHQSTNRMLQEIKKIFQALEYESHDIPSAFTLSQVPKLDVTENYDSNPFFESAIDDIDYLLLIDRRVDLYTPLCSPFTYEALLDTIQGINCTYLDVSTGPLNLKNSATEATTASTGNIIPQKSRLELNSNDSLFQTLRNLHQSEFGPFLHRKANEIQELYKEKDSLKSISEISEFMKKFKVKQVEHASLSTHVELASQIADVTKGEDYHKHLRLEDEIVQSYGNGVSSDVITNILEMIEKEISLFEIYRLLCLASLVNNGIRAKSLNRIKAAIIRQFGFDEFFRLLMLEKVGLLKVNRGKSQWEQIKMHFNLLINEVEAMKDISYVFSGYSPLSVRLLQMLFSSPDGWRSCSDQLNLLWGPAMEVRQKPIPCVDSEKAINSTSMKSQLKETQNLQQKKSVVLIFFLGGVTYGEVTAIRKLSEIEQYARKYIIATTSMINAEKLMSCMEQMPPIQIAA